MIRQALAPDGPAVLALARAFATSFVVESAAFDRTFVELIGRPDACLRVAEADGQIAGYVLGFEHPTFFANGRVAWVEEVMVAETFRRRGVGGTLMAEFEAWAAARGARLIALATRRAAVFYRALGYEESASYFRKKL
jgi:GNAT superfamily N-acetyltransferase